MKKAISISLILCLIALNLNAQTSKLDSLEILLQEHTQEDTIKVNLLNEIAYLSKGIDTNITLEYAEDSKKLATKIGFTKGQAKSLHVLGMYHSRKGNYSKALVYYRKSLKIFKKIDKKKEILRVSGSMGNIFQSQGDYPQALEYYSLSLKMSKELAIKRIVAINYLNIGIVYRGQGDYPTALEYYEKALRIKKELDDKKGVANLYNNIGVIYRVQNDYQKALEYYQKSLKIRQKIGSKNGIATSYNNIGSIYNFEGKYDKALAFYQKSLKIRQGLGDKEGVMKCLINLGLSHREQENYPKALNYLDEALKIATKIGAKSNESTIYGELALLNLEQENKKEAYNYAQKSYKLAKKIGDLGLIKESADVLAQSSEALGLFEEAYKYHVIFKTMYDSMYAEKNVKKLASLEFQYKFDKEKQKIELEQQKKDTLLAEEVKRQSIIRNSFITGFALMCILVLILYRNFLQKRKANNLLSEQNSQIEITNQALNATLETVYSQKDVIEKNHSDINASINYASRIQQALLPTSKMFSDNFASHFIIYQPKNIVSGDFYYLKKVNEYIVIAVADCTGHGIPGAFVSMLGIAFLNEIIGEKTKTASEILEKLRNEVKISLKQRQESIGNKDGMDIALCLINTKTNILNFAGAYNPLYLVRGNELKEIKGTRSPIGVFIKEKPFENHKIQLQKKDKIYLFSDGFQDQFGGENRDKFKIKKLRELIISINDKPLHKQEKILTKTLNDWGKDELKQTDDILIVGVEL